MNLLRHAALWSAMLSSLSVVAQPITIDRNDMPNVNDEFRWSVSDNLIGIIDLGDDGPDRVWEYQTLPAYSQRTESFVDPVFGTPLIYNVTFSSFFDLDHFATIAAPNPLGNQLFGFGPIQFEEVFDFYRETNAFFANVGMGATINGIPLTSRMEPRDFIYRFPMEYGSTDESFSQFAFDLPTIGHYGQKMLRTNTVDAWGTLTTRFGTFEVLRVYTELERTDTVSIQGFAFEQERPREFEYKWLGKNTGLPLLKVSGQFLFGQRVVNEVVYQDSVRGFTPPGPFVEPEPEPEPEPEDTGSTSIGQMELLDLQVYPNPVEAVLRLSFRSRTNGSLLMEVRDITGRRVAQPKRMHLAHGMQQVDVDCASLSPGTYIVTLTTDDGATLTTRFVRAAQ
jgi:hypothetical protein